MKTPVTHLTRQARHEFEMDAIAACFIGGTAVTGGIGTIPGAMVGALIMGVLNQGLSIMGVDAAWVKTIKGLVVIAAVAYDLLSKKKKGSVKPTLTYERGALIREEVQTFSLWPLLLNGYRYSKARGVHVQHQCSGCGS